MKLKYIITVIIISCALAAMPAGIVQAQTMATASGHIFNESNTQPVSGANIHVQNSYTSEDYFATTDGSGYYSFNLPAGDYHVTVDANNFLTWETDFHMETLPVTNDIYLTPEGGGNDGDDNVDDGGSGDSLFGDIDEDTLETMIKVLVTLVVIFFICLITMTVALVMMSVRLGKIRKELKAVNETLEEMVPDETPVPQAYQQPPEPPTQ